MSSCSKDTVGTYTPGPLYVGNDRDNDGFAYYYVGPENEQAARFYYEGEASGDRALADATLYAAAPDLLEALKGLLTVAEVDCRLMASPHPHRVMVIKHAQDAIAKALPDAERTAPAETSGLITEQNKSTSANAGEK